MKSNSTDDSWRLSAIRVTKYDSQYRNEHGHYDHSDWTSFSDIGKTFDNSRLTIEEYLKIESKYAAVAKHFFLSHRCSQITVRELTKFPYDNQDIFCNHLEVRLTYDSLSESVIVRSDNIESVVKLVLRGVIWCELHCTSFDNVAVRFGYDLYMYLNSPNEIADTISYLRQIGLFAD